MDNVDYSDSSFSLDGNTSTIPSLNGGMVQPQFATLHNGYLEINSSKKTIASITAFNLSGKVIFQKKQLVEAGVHAFPVRSETGYGSRGKLYRPVRPFSDGNGVFKVPDIYGYFPIR